MTIMGNKDQTTIILHCGTLPAYHDYNAFAVIFFLSAPQTIFFVKFLSMF